MVRGVGSPGRAPIAALVAIAAVAAIAPGAASAAATRAEFVAQADPICDEANRDIARLNRRFRDLHERARHKPAGQVLIKTGRRLADSIELVRSIAPPPGDEALVAQWLDLVQRVARNNVRMGKAHIRLNFRRHDGLFKKNARVRGKAHRLVADWAFLSCA